MTELFMETQKIQHKGKPSIRVAPSRITGVDKEGKVAWKASVKSKVIIEKINSNDIEIITVLMAEG